MTVFSGWGYTELCTLLEWLRVGTLLEWLLVGVIGSSVCELSQVMLSLLLETSKETQRGNARNDGSETVRGGLSYKYLIESPLKANFSETTLHALTDSSPQLSLTCSEKN